MVYQNGACTFENFLKIIIEKKMKLDGKNNYNCIALFGAWNIAFFFKIYLKT